MTLHVKTSKCSDDVNVHCLLCPEAMSCNLYLSNRYPGIHLRNDIKTEVVNIVIDGSNLIDIKLIE